MITYSKFRNFDLRLELEPERFGTSRRSETSEARTMEPTVEVGVELGSGTRLALGDLTP